MSWRKVIQGGGIGSARHSEEVCRVVWEGLSNKGTLKQI